MKKKDRYKGRNDIGYKLGYIPGGSLPESHTKIYNPKSGVAGAQKGHAKQEKVLTYDSPNFASLHGAGKQK